MSAPANREVVAFDTNIWQQFALKYATPKPVPSPKNPADLRMMFTLVDGRVLFLKTESAAKITALGVKPGELLEAAVLEKRDGQRKWVEFHARRADPPLETQTQLERQLRKSLDVVSQVPVGERTAAVRKAREAPAPTAAPPHANGHAAARTQPVPAQQVPAKPPVSPAVAQSVAVPRPPLHDADDPGAGRNGTNGHAASGHAANGHAAQAPFNPTGWTVYLAEQAKALIDVAAACHKYAAETYPGMLKAEDVSDLVTTAFISSRNGNR